jgi:hypothetical protein
MPDEFRIPNERDVARQQQAPVAPFIDLVGHIAPERFGLVTSEEDEALPVVLLAGLADQLGNVLPGERPIREAEALVEVAILADGDEAQFGVCFPEASRHLLEFLESLRG